MRETTKLSKPIKTNLKETEDLFELTMQPHAAPVEMIYIGQDNSINKRQPNYLVLRGKQILLSCMATVALTAASYLGIKSFSHEGHACSSLLIENIEALTQTENTNQTCTRVKRSHNCYRMVNGIRQWAAIAIDEVETYQRVSLVQVCEHAVVTSCPPGTIG